MGKPRYKGLNQKIEGTKLTPISFSKRRSSSRNAYYLFSCDCGLKKEMVLSDISYGRIKSCGCVRRKRTAKIMYLRGVNENEK